MKNTTTYKLFALALLLSTSVSQASWSHELQTFVGDARVWFDLIEGFNKESEPVYDEGLLKYQRHFGTADGAMKIYCSQWRINPRKDVMSACEVYLNQRDSSELSGSHIRIQIKDKDLVNHWIENLMGPDWKSFEKVRLTTPDGTPNWQHRTEIFCSQEPHHCYFDFIIN